MVKSSMNSSQDWHSFFRQGIVDNLGYWQDELSKGIDRYSALDPDRENILRAVDFGFGVPEVWPLLLDVVNCFSSYIDRSGYWSRWCQVLERALVVAEQLGQTTEVAKLSIILAGLLRRQGHFQEAVHYYRQAIQLARLARDQFTEARTCSNLGYYYAERGQWFRAEVLCRHALQIFEQLESTHGQAHTQNHLGILFTRQHAYEKAHRHLRQACNLWQQSSDNHGLMRGLINIGNLYIEVGESEQALAHLSQAHKLAEQTDDKVSLGSIYLNMGVAYRQLGIFDQAISYTQMAEPIFRNSLEPLELTRTKCSLGLIFLDQKQWPDARRLLEEAHRNYLKLGSLNGQIEALFGLAKYEMARGDLSQFEVQWNTLETFLVNCGRQYQLEPFQAVLERYRRDLSGNEIPGSRRPTTIN